MKLAFVIYIKRNKISDILNGVKVAIVSLYNKHTKNRIRI